jgi:hypothetical protein
MVKQRERVTLGQFECRSGELIVSDPCYDLDTWCAGSVKAKKGRWVARVETVDEGEWGKRVAILVAYHVEHEGASCTERAGFEVGVDSGQAGIFDKTAYKNVDKIPEDFEHKAGVICEDDPWYSYICDHTLREGHGGGIINGGVVTSSGFGDGGYECLLAMEGDEAVCIKITFIPEGESCDACGDTFDPDELSMRGLCDSCEEDRAAEEDEDDE